MHCRQRCLSPHDDEATLPSSPLPACPSVPLSCAHPFRNTPPLAQLSLSPCPIQGQGSISARPHAPVHSSSHCYCFARGRRDMASPIVQPSPRLTQGQGHIPAPPYPFPNVLAPIVSPSPCLVLHKDGATRPQSLTQLLPSRCVVLVTRQHTPARSPSCYRHLVSHKGDRRAHV